MCSDMMVKFLLQFKTNKNKERWIFVMGSMMVSCFAFSIYSTEQQKLPSLVFLNFQHDDKFSLKGAANLYLFETPPFSICKS